MPVRPPDLDELETLVICAAAGTMVGAAAELRISRPAVAKRLRNLETLAGQPLLERTASGVQLTDAGARLQAGSRRILEERRVLAKLLQELRGEEISPIAGLRDLIGYSTDEARAAQQPQALVAETERVLEIVLSASATAVIISDPYTALVHEVNRAFCEFTGRKRHEIVGRTTADGGYWLELDDRNRLIDEVRRNGQADRITVRALRPDSTIRVGEATCRYITIAGTRQMLTTINDVTEQHILTIDQSAGANCYRAFTKMSKLLLAGEPPLDSLATVLPEIAASAMPATVLLWNIASETPHDVAGAPPPASLAQSLADVAQSSDGRATRLEDPAIAADRLLGFAAAIPATGHLLVLLARESCSPLSQSLYLEVLSDLADLVGSAAQSTPAAPGRAVG